MQPCASLALLGSSVEELNVTKNWIGSDGGVAIARALPNSRIKRLYVDEMNSDDKAVLLVTALRKEGGRKLDFKNSGLGDVAAAALALALPSEQFRALPVLEGPWMQRMSDPLRTAKSAAPNWERVVWGIGILGRWHNIFSYSATPCSAGHANPRNP